MAYFEVDVLGGGNTRLDNAGLIDSDNWMIPAGTSIDMIIWNTTDTPVSVTLRASADQMLFRKDPDHYEDAQSESHYRSVTTTTSTLGDFIDVDHLGPGSVFPFVLANGTGSAQRWLDVDSCTMHTSGHGTNIFNGQRVYVMGHYA